MDQSEPEHEMSIIENKDAILPESRASSHPVEPRSGF
jgi:hypothetical protein